MCHATAVKLFGGPPAFASRCAPHSSTQQNMCLRSWDKFFKRHKRKRNCKINVRIQGGGDTCLGCNGIVFLLFFLSWWEHEHQSSPVVEMCAVCEISCSPWIKSLDTAPCRLFAACFCTLCRFACEAFCVYLLNSNFTSTAFVHLHED